MRLESKEIQEFQKMRKDQTYFVAMNFFNNEAILPHFMEEFFKLMEYLGKSNVFVSIYENGSEDRTKDLVEEFENRLQKEHIAHNVEISSRSKRGEWGHRIDYMARIRNEVMKPLYDFSKNKSIFPPNFSKSGGNRWILFINDIYFKLEDIVRLIHTNHFHYDMVCAMDFYSTFYDIWVARDINGDRMSQHYPYAADRMTQQLIEDQQPVNVKSCWNGAVVMTAEPFLKQRLTFRASILQDHCDSSECLLICKDFWNLGYQNILMNPAVRVAYDWKDYYLQNWITQYFNGIVGKFHRPQPSLGLLEVKEVYPEEWCTPKEIKDYEEMLDCYMKRANYSTSQRENRDILDFQKFYQNLEQKNLLPEHTSFVCGYNYVLPLNVTKNNMYHYFFF